MLVDHERAFIFIHIPKTAGKSISAALGYKENKKPHSIKLSVLEKHVTYFRFCFVRNPWDRVASAFFYSRRMVEKDAINGDVVREYIRAKPNTTFNQFVAECLNSEVKKRSIHFREQSYWIDRTSPYFIGRVEQIERHFAWVTRMIGIEGALPKLNASDRPEPLGELYTKESILKVASLYEEDIHRLGYLRDTPSL